MPLKAFHKLVFNLGNSSVFVHWVHGDTYSESLNGASEETGEPQYLRKSYFCALFWYRWVLVAQFGSGDGCDTAAGIVCLYWARHTVL